MHLMPQHMNTYLASTSRWVRTAGFTTVELLVVVAITGILAAVAAPSITSLVGRQKVKSVGSELLFSLLRARSEAVARNASLTLAPTAAGNWQQGWQILNPASASNVLDSHGFSNGTTITGPANVVYDGSGRVKGVVPPVFVIAAVIGSTSTYQCVSVDLGGRPYQKAASTC